MSEQVANQQVQLAESNAHQSNAYQSNAYKTGRSMNAQHLRLTFMHKRDYKAENYWQNNC